jgi:hypothetical protein
MAMAETWAGSALKPENAGKTRVEGGAVVELRGNSTIIE